MQIFQNPKNKIVPVPSTLDKGYSTCTNDQVEYFMFICLTLIMANDSSQGHFVTSWYQRHLGLDNYCGRGCPVHIGYLAEFVASTPLDASSISSTSCDNQKCLQTVPNITWKESHPQLRTTVVQSTIVFTLGCLSCSLAKFWSPITFSPHFMVVMLQTEGLRDSTSFLKFLFQNVTHALNLHCLVQQQPLATCSYLHSH